MDYVIVYDIENDRIRGKIADELESIGQRVQKSVFECKISDTDFNRVIDALNSLLDDNGSIRIYPLCAACYKKAIGLGKEIKIIGENGYEII